MIVLTWRRESQSVVQRPAPREKAYRGSEKHQGGEARHYGTVRMYWMWIVNTRGIRALALIDHTHFT